MSEKHEQGGVTGKTTGGRGGGELQGLRDVCLLDTSLTCHHNVSQGKLQGNTKKRNASPTFLTCMHSC